MLLLIGHDRRRTSSLARTPPRFCPGHDLKARGPLGEKNSLCLGSVWQKLIWELDGRKMTYKWINESRRIRYCTGYETALSCSSTKTGKCCWWGFFFPTLSYFSKPRFLFKWILGGGQEFASLVIGCQSIIRSLLKNQSEYYNTQVVDLLTNWFSFLCSEPWDSSGSLLAFSRFHNALLQLYVLGSWSLTC